jgi:hypothetical protein
MRTIREYLPTKKILSVKLYPEDDHWVMLQKATAVARDIRGFIEGKNFPKESVHRVQRSNP